MKRQQTLLFLDENERLLTEKEAKPCPFCGKQPSVKPVVGGDPYERQVSCVNDACDARPLVAGSQVGRALEKWNRRDGC